MNSERLCKFEIKEKKLDRMAPDTSVYPDINDILSYTSVLEKPKFMPG